MRQLRGNRVWSALVAVAALMGVGAGCGSTTIRDRIDLQYDPEVDFTQLRTFDFPPPTGGTEPPEKPPYLGAGEQILQDAVKSELESRGLTQTTTDPDLQIYFYHVVERRIAAAPIPCWWGPGGVWGWGPSYTCGWRTFTYDVGTVVIDVVRRSENRLVFQGAIIGIANGVNEEARVRLAIARIFSFWPANPAP